MKRYHSFICDSSRWEGFELRPGDVIVTTPPKAGTTWMQHCCLHLIHGGPPRAPLTEIAPWLDQSLERIDDVTARLDAQTHRRVIKTHTPMDGLPWSDDVTYIGVGRDPRDVALSYADHDANFDRQRAAELRVQAGAGEAPPPIMGKTLRDWIDIDAPPEHFGSTLRFTAHHLSTLWALRDRPNVHLFHYAAMKADLPGQLRRLADALGIPGEIDHTALTLDAMRARARDTAPNARTGLFVSPERFFAEGRVGGWQDGMTSDDLAAYDARIAALCPEPELRAWLHTGS
ncbi:MAG TPA: sulfotransferase domain-containing protein [Acidimicrobiales bacterium]|nr:sulfotransferase domain-containing protein [Acidimicrobiales bacterium]